VRHTLYVRVVDVISTGAASLDMKPPQLSKGYSFVAKRKCSTHASNGSYYGEMTKPLIGMTAGAAGVRARQQRAKAMYDLKFDLHFTDYPHRRRGRRTTG